MEKYKVTVYPAPYIVTVLAESLDEAIERGEDLALSSNEDERRKGESVEDGGGQNTEVIKL